MFHLRLNNINFVNQFLKIGTLKHFSGGTESDIQL